MLLLKRTGALTACWTRNGVSAEVVSVMAATLYGSVETMVSALGGPAPSTVFIETDLRHMLLSRVDVQNVLLLVAPRSVSRSVLRRELRRIRTGVVAAVSAGIGAPDHGASNEAPVVVHEPVFRSKR